LYFIEFKGKCFTKAGYPRERYQTHEQGYGHYELDMFYLRKTLFQGPFKMRASIYEYPFSFQFPEQFDYRVQAFRHHPSFLNQLGPQPLPPTYGEGENGMTDMFSTHYHLTAKIPWTISHWEYKVALNFSPYRTEESPAPLLTRVADYEKHHRHYRRTDEGTVSCLGEDSKFEIHWRNVRLFPAIMVPGIEEAIRAIEGETRNLGIEDQSNLPSYGEHAQMERDEEAEVLPRYVAKDEGR
jgi:hypothetical protein